MAVLTHSASIRYPDLQVYCGRRGSSNDEERAFDDPRVIFEIPSAGTAGTDLRVKLPDIRHCQCRHDRVRGHRRGQAAHRQRTGPGGWSEQAYDVPVDVVLLALGITLPHDEMFARD